MALNGPCSHLPLPSFLDDLGTSFPITKTKYPVRLKEHTKSKITKRKYYNSTACCSCCSLFCALILHLVKSYTAKKKKKECTHMQPTSSPNVVFAIRSQCVSTHCWTNGHI